MLNFAPPTTPTTAPDGTPRTVTGPEQTQPAVPVAMRSPPASAENGSGPFVARSFGFRPNEILKVPVSFP